MRSLTIVCREGSEQRVTPVGGEDVACAIAEKATKIVHSAKEHKDQHGMRIAAQLFYLASDSYRLAAGACLGHGRMMRYQNSAQNYEDTANELLEEAQRWRSLRNG